MDLFDIGIGELLVILVVALLVMEPGKVVDFARSLGGFMRKAKSATADIVSTVKKELDEEKNLPVQAERNE